MKFRDFLLIAFLIVLPAAIPPVIALELSRPILIQSALIAAASALILLIVGGRLKNALESQVRSSGALRSQQLLKEFEQDGRGWFWETDRHGNLRYISEKVAQKIGKKSVDLVGTPFKDLVVLDSNDEADDDRPKQRTLGFHLSSRTAFSDLSLKVKADDERRWSICGNPIVDDYGNFQGFRGSGTDLTDVHESQNAIQQLARFDTLTGLANRLEINRFLEKTLQGQKGQPKPCALFMMDLDRFKQVNDTLGHPAGDTLLRHVAQRLQRVVDQNGHVGRLGGDEFQIVITKISSEKQLSELADLIIREVSFPYQIGTGQVTIGASIGIATSYKDVADPSSLVRNADLALYAAKDAGRGVARFYKDSMHEEASKRRLLEDDLREAISRGELHLVYQPIVDMATETVSGFEALARWQHPVRGPISPDEFIPIAEDANLMGAIGEWIIRTACAQLARWPKHLRIAVNVSPMQFASPNLTALVMNAIAENKIAPEQLELEITERIFLNENSDYVGTVNRLKKLGVRLALDDFGTGYSALGYLKRVPFDKIKIDQSFVRGATEPGSINGAIITSIVSLAEALGMETTAEGAETHDELALIRSLGCSHVQGYIFGKPMAAEEAENLIGADSPELEPSGFDSHREPRRRTYRRIGVHHDGYCYLGLVRNISSGGAMIDGLSNVPKGTEFALEFDYNIVVRATARWSEGGRIGVQFNQQVDPERLGSGKGFEVRQGWLKDRAA